MSEHAETEPKNVGVSKTEESVPKLNPRVYGRTFAIDFDGTCVTHEFPRLGREIGASRVLRRIVEEGGSLILWTMRSGKHLREAETWFKGHDIPLIGVQRNPTQDEWTDSPKCYAHVYIDDAALGCPLKPGQNEERPYVDWDAVEAALWPSENVTTG
jgi:hypothetical protein